MIGISRASYYKWLNRIPTKRDLENTELRAEIIKLYDKVNGIYGYRRITMNLNKKLSKTYNYKRIYRIMKGLNLKSVIRKKKKRYVKSIAQYTAENTLNRNFIAKAPNTKWLTDVTEFKYGDKKAYLSAILDLYNNQIIGYILGHRNNNDLVFKTLDLVLEKYPSSKALIHSDRGYQYTLNGFKQKLEIAGTKQSMSRVGKCIDNGPMEGFFGIIKSEMYYLNRFETFEELQQSVDNYINFYNNKRLQQKLNNCSPVEFRALAV